MTDCHYLCVNLSRCDKITLFGKGLVIDVEVKEKFR